MTNFCIKINYLKKGSKRINTTNKKTVFLTKGGIMSNQPITFRFSCIKTLSAVEANPARSNQHEFNGVSQLKSIFGEERQEFKALFSLRGDSHVFESSITWYDAREAHATRSEYRLYFQSNPVMRKAAEGDNIIIGFDRNGNVHCELIPSTNPDYSGRFSEWRAQ